MLVHINTTLWVTQHWEISQKKIKMCIDLWVPESSDAWGISVKATLSPLCSSKIEAAVEAARAAFPGWSSRSPQERSQVLHRLADLLEMSLEDLAQAESKDQGESRWRVWRAHSAGLFLFLLPGSLSQSQGLSAAVPYKMLYGKVIHYSDVSDSFPPSSLSGGLLLLNCNGWNAALFSCYPSWHRQAGWHIRFS